MTEESKETNAHAKAVVDPIRMPKMKIANSTLAKLNAWAIAGAAFFGYATIFVAAASFTNDWHFEMPLLNIIRGANSSDVESSLIAALAALIFSIFAVVTIGKITDAAALKKAWKNISSTFLVLVIFYVINMLAIILYSLMSLGRRDFNQGELWLSSFLPTVILCCGATTMYLCAKSIARGKTSILRLLSVFAVMIATAAFVTVFVQQMISFYGKNTTPTIERDNYDNYYNNFYSPYDLFR